MDALGAASTNSAELFEARHGPPAFIDDLDAHSGVMRRLPDNCQGQVERRVGSDGRQIPLVGATSDLQRHLAVAPVLDADSRPQPQRRRAVLIGVLTDDEVARGDGARGPQTVAWPAGSAIILMAGIDARSDTSSES